MPPYPASGCCRVVRRPIASPRDAIWISDSVLAQVLERFCLAYRPPQQRRVSSVPGPLESRRRLGKRQIGDLNSLQSHASLPQWAQPLALDLSQWQWYPPTGPSERGHGIAPSPSNKLADALGIGSLRTSLHEWMDSLQDPIEVFPAPSARATSRQADLKLPSLFEQCTSLRTTIAHLPSDQAIAACQEVLQRFQQDLNLGLLSKEDIESVHKTMVELVSIRFAGSAANTDLQLRLFSAIVDGLASCRVLSLAALDMDFWSGLLINMSRLPACDEVWRLFVTIMGNIPEDYVNCMQGAILPMLSTLLSSWEPIASAGDKLSHGRPTKLDAGSTQQSRVSILANALKNIDPTQHDILVETCTGIILSRTGPPEWQHSVRYSWLSVLAHMPLVNQELLLEVSSRLFRDEESSRLFSSLSICHLLIGQWESRGYLDQSDEARRLFERVTQTHPESGMGALVFAIFRSQTPARVNPVFISLWKFVRALDCTDELITSLQRLGEHRALPRRLIEAVAWASNDHRVALELHAWYVEKMWKTGQPKWGAKFWEKFAERMIMDPAVSPHILWEVLHVEARSKAVTPNTPEAWRGETESNMTNNGPSRGDGGGGGESSTSCPTLMSPLLLEKMAMGFSRAPHLRNRVALRHVSQCVRLLVASQSTLPPSVVKSLLRVITKDLSEGRPGRTERLRYVLSLVQRHQGTKAALLCGQAIQRWRAVHRRRLGSFPPLPPTEEQLDILLDPNASIHSIKENIKQ